MPPMLKFPTDSVWLLLLAATGLTYWLGESGQLGHARLVPVFIIFAAAKMMHPACGATCCWAG